jgi:hypothetical protein
MIKSKLGGDLNLGGSKSGIKLGTRKTVKTRQMNLIKHYVARSHDEHFFRIFMITGATLMLRSAP